MLEFVTEKGCAVAFWRFRKIEGQGGQSIHHTEVAHVAAIDGLHPDDADDDLCRYAELCFGALQGGSILAPKFHASLNANRVDEAAAVDAPILPDHARAGGLHGTHKTLHSGDEAGLADGLAHPFFVEISALGHVVCKAHDFFAVCIGLILCRAQRYVFLCVFSRFLGCRRHRY